MTTGRDSEPAGGPGKFASLTVPQKWEWHAEIYAFRRVALGIAREERTSPCDLQGIWFHESSVDAAERRLRATWDRRVPWVQADMAAAGRAVSNDWARRCGYLNFKDYLLQNGLAFESDYDYAEGMKRVVTSVLASIKTVGRPRKKPAPRPSEFSATAERLRAGRIALGLERAEQEPPE